MASTSAFCCCELQYFRYRLIFAHIACGLQPDTIAGDIVFVLQLKEHPKFKRKFDDLYVEHTISLTEALCGFQFALTHLDGRQLLIKSNPGEVIKPGIT